MARQVTFSTPTRGLDEVNVEKNFIKKTGTLRVFISTYFLHYDESMLVVLLDYTNAIENE